MNKELRGIEERLGNIERMLIAIVLGMFAYAFAYVILSLLEILFSIVIVGSKDICLGVAVGGLLLAMAYLFHRHIRPHIKRVIAITVVAIAAGVGLWSLIGGSGVTPYVDFAEARAAGSNVQVMGEILPAGTDYDPTKGTFSFFITDDSGDMMKVVYGGTKPGNFDQATSVVCIGRYTDEAFHAERLLVKCPSKYQDELLQPGA
jgi:cytochrome c-type biogenesis protein CcmE